MFIVGGFVEILQRFHALVLRATRRVAMVQHWLEKHLALWIVSGTREEGEEGYALIVGNFGLISKSIIGNSNGLKEFMLFAFNITNLIKI